MNPNQIYNMPGIELLDSSILIAATLALVAVGIWFFYQLVLALIAAGMWVGQPTKAQAVKTLGYVPTVFGLGIVAIALLQARVNPQGFLDWVHRDFPIVTGVGGSAATLSMLNLLQYFFLLLTFAFGVTLFGSFIAIPLAADWKAAGKNFVSWLIPFIGVAVVYIISSSIAAGGNNWMQWFKWLIPSVPQG